MFITCRARALPVAVRVLLASLLLVAGACSGGSSSSRVPPADGTVAGAVTGHGAALAGATVVLVSADAVAESDSIQPFEDLAADSTLRASTAADGSYALAAPPGRYFLYVEPPVAETRFLPGGDAARVSFVLGEDEGVTRDTELSGRPPDGALAVGTTRCLGCHGGLAGHGDTLHAVGLRAVGATGSLPSALQDLSGFPDADGGLAYFEDGNPLDNTGPGDGYGQRVAGGALNVLLGKDATGYFQAIESIGGGEVSEPLYVELVYGGEGIYRQSYLTRLDASGAHAPAPDEAARYVLPAEFTETRGREGDVAEVTEPGWRLFEPDAWAPPAVDGGSPVATPTFEESFDARCAGCHFNGMRLTRSGDGLFLASAVADTGGAIDYDGDGLTEEINVGCEGCHGPGSAHVSNPSAGGIVHPGRLPPGRAAMLCGACHARGEGNGTIDGEGRPWYPSRTGASGVESPLPGISPAEFFGTADGEGILPSFGTSGGFFDPIDLSLDEGSWRDRSDGFGAERDHARLSMQHYFDHTRSPHARNPFEIVACWDCHDVHGRAVPAQLRESADDNLLCWRCHAGLDDFAAVSEDMVDALASTGVTSSEMATAVHEHQRERTFDLIGVSMNLGPSIYLNPGGSDQLGRCTTCHMPRTARSGSEVVDADGFTIRGDVSSHTFDMISPDVSETMAGAGAEPVPNSCVECHRGVLRGSWPDYRFMTSE